MELIAYSLTVNQQPVIVLSLVADPQIVLYTTTFSCALSCSESMQTHVAELGKKHLKMCLKQPLYKEILFLLFRKGTCVLMCLHHCCKNYSHLFVQVCECANISAGTASKAHACWVQL